MIFDSFDNCKKSGNLIKWFRFWHNELYQKQQKIFNLYRNEMHIDDIMVFLDIKYYLFD
jgi:hypothetical protein